MRFIRLIALLPLAFLSACPKSRSAQAPPPAICPPPSGIQHIGYGGDLARTGWNSHETRLTPEAVASAAFGGIWASDAFDTVSLDRISYPAHLYASLVYLDDVTLTGSAYAGSTASLVFAAANTGWTYAVNAVATHCADRVIPAGAIVWKTQLGTPLLGVDGSVLKTILSTPVLDASTSPPRLYVVAMTGNNTFAAYALDATSGSVLPGWPVSLDAASVAAVAPGAPAFAPPWQRAALTLSLHGDRLYVPFPSLGWLLSIDTRAAHLAEAFVAAPVTANENGGTWAPGGASVDARGTLYITTGNAPEAGAAQPGYWGESLLAWKTPLMLSGVYTPFNYCQLEKIDADLGSGAPMIFDLDPTRTSTPHLVAFGSKQGNVYLVDRDHLSTKLDARGPCSADGSSDTSLLPPEAQPQFGTRGPLNVFGPYTELFGNLNYAKMRTTPALFVNDAGDTFLYATGTTKIAVDGMESKPPSVVRLRVVASAGKPAYLAVDGADTELAFVTPGSPFVSSDGGKGAVLWVYDANWPRTKALSDPGVPSPVLVAIDGSTLKVLWKSAPSDLHVGAKYTSPVVAHGVVFVGTDRVEAFSLR